MTITRNRLASFLAVTALLGGLTACSNEATPKANERTPSTSAPSTNTTEDPSADPSEPLPTVSQDPTTGKYDYCKNQKPFTGAAADKFGAKDVANAYCTYVTLEMEQSFVESVVRSDATDLTPADFTIWREHMTATAAEDLDKVLKNVIGGANRAEGAKLLPLMYFNMAGGDSGYEWAGSEPVALNQSFTPAKTYIDTKTGPERLVLMFDVNADFNLLKAGTDKHYLFPFKKTVSLYLIKSPTAKGSDDPNEWYLDAWYADYKPGTPFPRPANMAP